MRMNYASGEAEFVVPPQSGCEADLSTMVQDGKGKRNTVKVKVSFYFLFCIEMSRTGGHVLCVMDS